ncbi:hypothetical protein KCU73_g3720, partial [Aureobasidium melanogenum]
MRQRDIEFQTSDHVTLRGWLFTPEGYSGSKLPCLVMTVGFSGVKEMGLPLFAEYFVKNIPIACLAYDHRGFGSSDVQEGQPRQEVDPRMQQSDYSDAITFAQGLSEVNPEQIAIWGTSYSGGHVIYVGAVDRRVKAVLSQVPFVNGWETFSRSVRPDLTSNILQLCYD